MIVLGSHSVQAVVGRESKDLDLLATLPEFQEYIGEGNRPTIHDRNHAYFKGEDRIYDCELIWPDSNSLELAELILTDPNTTFDEDLQAWVPSLNVLYMLKMSHRYKKNSPHFLKTMDDIWLMRDAGAVIQDEHRAFYERRKAETYWYEHPNLDRTKDEFFNPEDEFYVYDHDSIHVAVAVDPLSPAYLQYAVDGAEVLSSKAKFFAGSHQMRINGVYEEACVLALERSQIPHDFNPSMTWSFQTALMKVCTSITSGWFREFAWEHHDEVLRLYHERVLAGVSYLDLFRKNQHVLRPYERKEAA